MNRITISKTHAGKFSLPKKAALAAAMLLAFSSNAGAFSDGPALVQRVALLIQQIAAYKLQLDQLVAQTDQMRRDLIPDSTLFGFTPIQRQDSLKKRGDTEGIEFECPGADAGGLSIASLGDAANLDLKGSTKKAQAEICVRTLLARNAQFNESVKILEGVRDRDVELQKINRERAAITQANGGQGQLDDNTNKLQAVLNKATVEMQYSTAVISAYDSYIHGLERNQSQLGEQALKGDNQNKSFAERIVTKFAQGVILEGALEAAKSRDR